MDKSAKYLALALAAVGLGCSDSAKPASEEADKPQVDFQANIESLVEQEKAQAVEKAKAMAFAIKGRKLFAAVIAANLIRFDYNENLNRLDYNESVWPHTDKSDGLSDNASDIAGQVFNSSTEYFNALFDLNKPAGSRNPYVDCDISVLDAPIILPYSGEGKLESENVPWIVASGFDDETVDHLPIMVSANLDPSILLGSWDGKTDADKSLESAVKGDFKTVVIVRKGGGSDIVKAEDLNYKTLYGQPFAMPENLKLRYLTPTGAVAVQKQ